MGARLSEAVPQGTEGRTERSAPQLSPEHQRGERDVGALPPAALGRRLPGRALCADCGSEPHPEHDCDHDSSDHQQDSSDDGDDFCAGHQSSTRWAPAQRASCTRPPAAPPALPAVRAGPGPGRAALQQHGGRSESSPGRDRSGGGGGAPRRAGAAEPRWPLGSLPPQSVPRRGAFKKCLVIPSLTSAWEEGTWLPPAVVAVWLIVGRGDSPPKLAIRSNSLSLVLVICPSRSCLRKGASPGVGKRGKETEDINACQCLRLGSEKISCLRSNSVDFADRCGVYLRFGHLVN